ncbi:MAG: hypothetical protein WD075_10275 [Rhodospirillales bacterium]
MVAKKDVSKSPSTGMKRDASSDRFLTVNDGRTLPISVNRQPLAETRETRAIDTFADGLTTAFEEAAADAQIRALDNDQSFVTVIHGRKVRVRAE